MLFCVASDFNQTRDDSTDWLANTKAWQLLTDVLEQHELNCLTIENFRATGKLQTQARVDHICLTKGSFVSVQQVGAWEGFNAACRRMSDHNGVRVEVEMK